MMDARLIEFYKKEADDSVNAVHQNLCWTDDALRSQFTFKSIPGISCYAKALSGALS